MKSLAALLETHYNELRNFALSKVRNWALAEDIVQDACLRLATAGHGNFVNPRAYLYRTVGNLVIDRQRQETRRGRYISADLLPDDVAHDEPDAEDCLIEQQRLGLLSRAVAELPPRCQQCFVMRCIDELHQDEIARRLGISRNMVEKHLRNAVLHCARRLREDD